MMDRFSLSVMFHYPSHRSDLGHRVLQKLLADGTVTELGVDETSPIKISWFLSGKFGFTHDTTIKPHTQARTMRGINDAYTQDLIAKECKTRIEFVCMGGSRRGGIHPVQYDDPLLKHITAYTIDCHNRVVKRTKLYLTKEHLDEKTGECCKAFYDLDGLLCLLTPKGIKRFYTKNAYIISSKSGNLVNYNYQISNGYSTRTSAPYEMLPYYDGTSEIFAPYAG